MDSLIYQLQHLKMKGSKELFCNDVTINVTQYAGGTNRMPKEKVEDLLHAANEFLYLEFGYPEPQKEE